MINKKLRKKIDQYCTDNDCEIVFFENPSFDNSIVGISYDNRLIYDYDKMAQELSFDDKIPLDEAYDFLSYDTLRALPYFPENKPIILYYDL